MLYVMLKMKKIAYLISKQQLNTDLLILYPFYSRKKNLKLCYFQCMNLKIRVSKGLNEAANQYIYIQRVFKYEIAAMDDNSVVYQSTAHQTKKKSNLLKYMIGVLDIS